MKKISTALLVSLSLAGIGSAQASNDGIVTTHDANVAAQIEQHARNVQARPAVAVEQDAQAAVDHAVRKPAEHPHHKRHNAYHHAMAKAKKAHTSVASE